MIACLHAFYHPMPCPNNYPCQVYQVYAARHSKFEWHIAHCAFFIQSTAPLLKWVFCRCDVHVKFYPLESTQKNMTSIEVLTNTMLGSSLGSSDNANSGSTGIQCHPRKRTGGTQSHGGHLFISGWSSGSVRSFSGEEVYTDRVSIYLSPWRQWIQHLGW